MSQRRWIFSVNKLKRNWVAKLLLWKEQEKHTELGKFLVLPLKRKQSCVVTNYTCLPPDTRDQLSAFAYRDKRAHVCTKIWFHLLLLAEHASYCCKLETGNFCQGFLLSISASSRWLETGNAGRVTPRVFLPQGQVKVWPNTEALET